MNNNFFVENKETGKIELHFDKSAYMALSDAEKSTIKSNFLFSRASGAWVSRCKWPRLSWPIKIAQDLGLENAGTINDRLSFEEQQERKAERAEARAERYEEKAGRAYDRGKALQKPIDDMHGDIAFFTQPNINTSAGRAFTNRRNRMFAAWERGFEEYRKSEYYRDRAESARKSAEMPAKDFCQRRIDDALKTIRAQRRNIETYKSYIDRINGGEEIKSWQGNTLTIDQYIRWTEEAEEVIEAAIDKAAYYDALIQAQGGVNYSKDNIKAGDLVKVKHWGTVKVLRTGPKNFTFAFTLPHMTYANGEPMQGKAAYAEII